MVSPRLPSKFSFLWKAWLAGGVNISCMKLPGIAYSLTCQLRIPGEVICVFVKCWLRCRCDSRVGSRTTFGIAVKHCVHASTLLYSLGQFGSRLTLRTRAKRTCIERSGKRRVEFLDHPVSGVIQERILDHIYS